MASIPSVPFTNARPSLYDSWSGWMPAAAESLQGRHDAAVVLDLSFAEQR